MVHNSLTNPLSDKRRPPLSVFSDCMAFGSAARDKGSTFELDFKQMNKSDFRIVTYTSFSVIPCQSSIT
jgi:hypothetical protein